MAEGWRRAEWDASIAPPETNGVAQLPGQLARWRGFVEAVESRGPLGINHEAAARGDSRPRTDDVGAHNAVLSFGYAAARSVRPNGSLSLLDWGGGLGHYFLIARALLPDVTIAYSCHDAPEVCASARALLPEATFIDDDSWSRQKYDLVVASAALTLNEDWRAILARLTAASTSYVYIARVAVVCGVASFATLQRAYTVGSDVGWLQWALNKEEFVAEARSLGLMLAREFLGSESMAIRGAPAPIGTRHFLFLAPGGAAR